MVNVTERWKTTYPDAHAGVLVMREADNPSTHPELESRKKELEAQLRKQFVGQDHKALDSIPTIAVYNAYYKRFKKTYAVQAQLESIVFKGRSIPSVAALVEAMFMAEVKNMLLTAGHDFDQLKLPVTLDVASGDEVYTLLRGQEQMLKAGDMHMADSEGVVASVIYGPDQRTQISPATRNVLFAVYAPAGISKDAVQSHLQDIRDYVLVVSPNAQVDLLRVFGNENS